MALPTDHLNNEVDRYRSALARIRALILDVDGVLTDGLITSLSDGFESKSFHVHDGEGIKQVQEAGIAVAFMSGRGGRIVKRRARELGVKHVFLRVKDKGSTAESFLGKLNLTTQECAHIGDDTGDLALFDLVAISVAVADATPDVAKRAKIHLTKDGGRGAVREFTDILLRAQRRW